MNIQEISESSGGQLPKSNCNTVAKLLKNGQEITITQKSSYVLKRQQKIDFIIT